MGESIKVLVKSALGTNSIDSVESSSTSTVSIDKLFIITTNDVAFTRRSHEIEVSAGGTSPANTILSVVVSVANALSIYENLVCSTSPNASLNCLIVPVSTLRVASTANTIDQVSSFNTHASR